LSMDDANEQEFPTECPYCGTRLESAVVDQLLSSRAELADHDVGAVVFRDFCPNPDCLSKQQIPGGGRSQLEQSKSSALACDRCQTPMQVKSMRRVTSTDAENPSQVRVDYSCPSCGYQSEQVHPAG
jgi:aspartate carbamoyltransferase regulatory subunit